MHQMGVEVAILNQLRRHVNHVAGKAYVPYSQHPVGAVLLLADGYWIPGVRVENASFPLMISAIQNVWTTTFALQRKDAILLALSRPFTKVEQAFIQSLWPAVQFVTEDVATWVTQSAWPTVGAMLSPFLTDEPNDDEAGIRLARSVAQRAWIPESDFPVGCVLETSDGYLPGCNVEHTDWHYTLCAERNVLSMAMAYGISTLNRLHLSCLKAPGASPCGACRQVLVELATTMPIVIDEGSQRPTLTDPETLLPNYFKGTSLRRHQ